MNTFISLVRKESLHILRDRRTMFINIVMPLILLLLFGFAISNEITNIRIAAVVTRHNQDTQQIIERLRQNSYIDFVGMTNPIEINTLMRKGAIDAALVISPNNDGNKSQIIVDASNSTMAQSSVIYLRSILSENQRSPFNIRVLYNPELKSSYSFVPGIMGMIFIMICAMMTSVSIVREKETGTMDVLLVSPIKPETVVIGKLVPYFILSCLILGSMLLMSYTVLELPFGSQVWAVIGVSILYVILSLAIGLFVSTVVETQLAALMVSAVMFMVPVVMFSGMLFPIDSMPKPLQWFSCIVPARWYIAAVRKLMIQELPLSYVYHEILILAGSTIAILAVAINKFRARS